MSGCEVFKLKEVCLYFVDLKCLQVETIIDVQQQEQKDFTICWLILQMRRLEGVYFNEIK